MRVFCHGVTVSIEGWSDVDEAVRAYPTLQLVNPESPGDGSFYTIRAVTDTYLATAEGRILGFQMDSRGDVPTLLGADWGSTLILGCNSDVYFISPSLDSHTRVELESRFNSFFINMRARRLLLSLETAIVAFDEGNSLVWRVDLDIVTAVRWQQDRVLLDQMDGPRISVDVRTGVAERILQ